MNSTQSTRKDITPDAALVKTLEMFSIEDNVREEMQRLAAANQELLGKAHEAGPIENVDECLQKEMQRLGDVTQELVHDGDDRARLQRENAELRARVEELEHALQAVPAEASRADTGAVSREPGRPAIATQPADSAGGKKGSGLRRRIFGK
jgi:hypothetical protein